METLGKMAIKASLLNKVYVIDDLEIKALENVNLEVEKGQFVSINGPSGSGKTTLLNIVGGIDKPTSGEIVVLGQDLNVKNEDLLADFRSTNIGFVFQSYNLVSTLSVAENIAFPMEWIRKPGNQIESSVERLLRTVELEHRAEHFPSQLSGGEQQRVAFARALANDPPVLLVDEPTGNLDVKTGLKISEILRKLKADAKTIVSATHDLRIIELADKRLHLENGMMVSQDERVVSD